MRRILLCICWLLPVASGFANKKDSLLNVLTKYPARDTQRCFLLNQLIEEEQDNTVWMRYNKELRLIAEQGLKSTGSNSTLNNTYIKYLSIAFNNEGADLVYTDQYEAAIHRYRQADSWAKKIAYHEGRSLALQNIGTAFDFLGKLDSALHYFEQSHQEALLSGDRSSIAYVLTDLGYVNNNLGNNTLAIKYNFDALKIFEQLKDEVGMERTTFAIGRIFDGQKDFPTSLLYYKRCLDINTRIGDEIRQSIVLNSMANAYNNLQQYAASVVCLQKAITIAQKTNNVSVLAASYDLLGDVNSGNRQYDTAVYYYLQSAGIYKHIEGMYSYAKELIKLGEISLIKQQAEKAAQYAEDAYEIAGTSVYPALKKNAAEIISKACALQGNYKKAYEYKSIAAMIADSIFFDESRSMALKADFKYQSEKAESKIKELAQQKKISELKARQKNTLLYAVLLMVLILSLMAYFMFTRYKARKENELLRIELEESEKRAVIEQQRMEADLTALKSQMNPHFIFNALNSIQELYMAGDKRTANEQMGNFASLTRKILDVSGKRKIELMEEIDILTKYLELEGIRFEHDFSFKIHVSEKVDADYVSLPPMLIQPLVENSMKHGLLHKKGNKRIDIYFDIDNEETLLQCTIEDNGIGRKAAETINKNRISHQSFSTSATEKRLKLLNAKTSADISIQYEDKYDEDGQALGTVVRLQIPV